MCSEMWMDDIWYGTFAIGHVARCLNVLCAANKAKIGFEARFSIEFCFALIYLFIICQPHPLITLLIDVFWCNSMWDWLKNRNMMGLAVFAIAWKYWNGFEAKFTAFDWSALWIRFVRIKRFKKVFRKFCEYFYVYLFVLRNTWFVFSMVVLLQFYCTFIEILSRFYCTFIALLLRFYCIIVVDLMQIGSSLL